MSKKSKGDASNFESPEELARKSEAEAIAIPQGQSKVKTLIIWGLMIFVLFIFSVGDSFESAVTGDGQPTDVHLSWKGIDGEPRALDIQAFYAKKREYAYLQGTPQRPGVFAGLRMNIDVNKDADVARLIVMADLARGAGIRVTDSDLASTLLALFGTSDNYQSTRVLSEKPRRFFEGWIHNQHGLTTKQFEKTLRGVLSVQRFSGYLALGAGAVDHEQLVKNWQATRTEYSFDYVVANTAEFEPEVQAELPDTQALNAWLLALPADQQSGFHSPERWEAEFAILPVPAAEGAGDSLLAAYPRPEDEEASAKARDYYNSFLGTRFMRPAEAPADDAGDEEPEASPDTPFFSFDEVEALCLIEAPLYYSLVDWHLEVQGRVANGEVVDLAAECERLGLTLSSDATPRSLEEWNELDVEWAEGNLGNTLRFTQAERFSPSLRVGSGGLVASRVKQRIAPALPDFPEIEAEVAAAWIKDKAAFRAEMTLDGIRDRLGEREPGGQFVDLKTTPEQFAEAANNAGSHAQKDFTVQHRAFEERNVRPKPGAEPSLIEAFLRFNTLLFSYEEGIVMKPTRSRDLESVFLVLVGPTRPADVSKMQPQDLVIQRNQMEQASIQGFLSSTFDFENDASQFLKNNFDYFLYSEEEEVEDSKEG